jgi:hypothetical protein
LTEAERAVEKSYGGWTTFMQTYGLKAYDDDHIAEAKAIISGLAKQQSSEFKEDAGNKGKR